MSAVEYFDDSVEEGLSAVHPGVYDLGTRSVRVLSADEEPDLSVPLSETARTSGEGIEMFLADEADREEWSSRIKSVRTFEATGFLYFDDDSHAGQYIRTPVEEAEELIVDIAEVR